MGGAGVELPPQRMAKHFEACVNLSPKLLILDETLHACIWIVLSSVVVFYLQVLYSTSVGV